MPKPVVGPVWVIDPNGGHAHTVDDVWEVIRDGEMYGDTFTLYRNDGPAGSQSLWSEVKDGFGTLTEAIDYAEANPKAGTFKVRLTRNEIGWLIHLAGMAADPATGIVDTASGVYLYRGEAAREVFAFLSALKSKLSILETGMQS
jgi:hypothetical protein